MVITDRGTPVARIVAIDATAVIDHDSRGHHQPSDQRDPTRGWRQAPTRTETPGRRNRQ